MKRLERYQIVRELGRGAMGIVYLAHDPKLDRRVAIKTLQVLNSLDKETADEAKERFRREAKIAAGLNHPYILTVYDFDETADGEAFIVMEFVEGQTLDQVLKSGQRFSEAAVIALMLQTAEALGYAHQRGIVHRDIKPANLMRTTEGIVKIMDFGIARIADSELTQGGIALGSPSYMSPEQILGGTLDGRSDLFSLGVTAYQLLTGERPFTGESAQAVTYRIINQDPLEPIKLNPTLRSDWNSVLARLLAKAPEARYPSAEALCRDLGRMQSGQPLGIPATDATLALPAGTQALATGAQPAPWMSTGQQPTQRMPEVTQPYPVVVRPPFPVVRLLVGLAFLLLLGFGGAWLRGHFGSPIRQARRLIEGGNPKLAMSYLDDVLRRDPANVEALYWTARARKELGEDAAALETLNTLIRVDPRQGERPETAQWAVDLMAGSEAEAAQDLVIHTLRRFAEKPLREALDRAQPPELQVRAMQALSSIGLEVEFEQRLDGLKGLMEQGEADLASDFHVAAFPAMPEDEKEELLLVHAICHSGLETFQPTCFENALSMLADEEIDAEERDALAASLVEWLVDPRTQPKIRPGIEKAAGPETRRALWEKAKSEPHAARLKVLRLMAEMGQPADAEGVAALMQTAVEGGKESEARDLLDFLVKEPPSRDWLYWHFRLMSRKAPTADRFAAFRQLVEADPRVGRDEAIMARVASLAYRKDLTRQERQWLAAYPPFLPMLESQLKSADYDRRWDAVQALEGLEVKVDRAPVYKIDLKHENMQVRLNALRGLQKIGASVDLIPLWIQELERADSCDLRRTITEWLGEYGDDRAIPSLQRSGDKGFFDNLCMIGVTDDAIEAIRSRSR